MSLSLEAEPVLGFGSLLVRGLPAMGMMCGKQVIVFGFSPSG